MEVTGLSVGKSALNGALNYAKSTIAEEVALQLGVQRDQAFIRDELEMMLSFLMAAHEERDDHKVVKTWVKQVREVAYDVEDCLQDLVVRLGKPTRWCFLRTLVDRHRVATWMKELRVKVEDVSQRNVRYRLIKDTTGSKPGTGAGSTSIISSATMFGIEEARRQKDKAKVDLYRLINEGNQDLRVIAVWGTGGVLGQTVVMKAAYDNLKRSKMFKLYAWIRIVHPFNPLEFLQCIMRQFYQISFEETGKTQEKISIGAQVLKKMGIMKHDDLVDAFSEHVNEKRYLIVLCDLSIEEWDVITGYFPDNKKGSRIIVSTEHGEVASLCAGQESTVSELNQSSVEHSIFASYNKASQNLTALMEPGRSSSIETTLGTNNSVMVMPTDEIVENEFVGDNEKIARKSLTRLGSMAWSLEESQLMGREKDKSHLINLISKQDDQQFMVISVWGMGGLGKTTLVKEIYQSQELSGSFDKRACVTIMRPFVLQDVLENLYMQLDAESYNKKDNDVRLGRRKITENEATVEELSKLGRKVTAKALIEKLDSLLKGKRCLIVLDDLSSLGEWSMIIQSLPKMNSMCRIVITTREENIARHCSQKQENICKLQVLEDRDAIDLFTKKVFKEAINLDEYPALFEEGRRILKKCNGLPLAIVTIGGFLAKQPKTSIVWRKMNEHISAELEMNPELGIIRAILMKSYDGLPYHLKSCFLYMSIFPEDYNISRRRLVRRWNVEGYSSEVRGKSMGEIADSYFMELIERSMVLPSIESVSSIIGSRKGISYCKLHDLMREISISKAMEENLVFRIEEGCSLNTQGTIRHVSISSNWEGDQNEFERAVDLSRIRSLTVFGKWKPFYISDKMKLLRVLDLESTSGLVDHHLVPIWKLLHLKYLSLRECDGIFHLSESIGNLKQLETLDVTHTRIIKLPQAITKLRKLQYIRAGRLDNQIFGELLYDDWAEEFPKLIRNKLCLWTLILIVFCISSCSLNLAKSLMRMEDETSTNRRDVCTFYCCAMFPFLARIADPIGIVVPRGLRKLRALHTLGVVNIARGGKAILHEIKRLTQLRKLAVTGINKKNCHEFCSTLASLSSLESLLVHSVEEGDLRDCLDSLHTPPDSLQSLKLIGTLGKLPEWIAGLHNLVKLKLEHTNLTDLDGTMQVLGKLPNLTILCILDNDFMVNTERPSRLSCRREAFPSLAALELLYADIESVLFEEGTAPKLELLVARGRISSLSAPGGISSFSQLFVRGGISSFSGLSCLPSLKKVEVMFEKALMDDVQQQLSRNPNKPVLKCF